MRTCSSFRYHGGMGNPVIIDAVRTPQGKRKGWLAGLHPGQMLGFVQEEVLRRSGVDRIRRAPRPYPRRSRRCLLRV